MENGLVEILVGVLTGVASLVLWFLLLRALYKRLRRGARQRSRQLRSMLRGDLHEQVPPGTFPFRILEGPEESRYLTWLRNHSNYMATSGARDYVRAISVLVRGILINILVLLPYLLLISVIVAARHLFLPASFELTWIFGIGVITSVLLFPLLTPLFKIARHRTQLRTGSDSSVKLRDRWERLYGSFLILLVALAGFEALAVFLDDFHQLRRTGRIGTTQLATVAAAAVAIFTGADKLLNLVGGAVRKLALLGLGALGVLVPLLVILFVSDYLVYAAPSREWSDVTGISFLSFLVVIGFAIVVGAVTLSFTWDDFTKLCILLLVAIKVGFPLAEFDQDAWQKSNELEEQLFHALSGIDEASKTKLIAQMAERPGPMLEPLFGLLEWSRETVAPALLRPADDDPALFAKANEPRADAELADTRTPIRDSPNLQEGSSPEELLRELSAYRAFAPGISPLIERLLELSEEEQESVSSEIRDLTYTAGAASLTRHFESREKAGVVKGLIDDLGPGILTVSGRDGWYPQYAYDTDGPLFPRAPPLERELFAQARESIHGWGGQLIRARKELAVLVHFSRTEYPTVYATETATKARFSAFRVKFIHLSMFLVLLLALGWLTVDVNLTSIHGLYRDRLASAFLVGVDTEGDVDVEKDLDLPEICCHEAGSTAPYHLINVALNLQGSRDMGVRDRQSDFFIFSKRFIGGKHTGYCRSEAMEFVFPQMDLATAMAISAGAASPNMGRVTTPALTALMLLLNVRLGYWVPNPGLLERWLSRRNGGRRKAYSFPEVFAAELGEIERRWEQLRAEDDDESVDSERTLSTDPDDAGSVTPAHGLIGIGFSGGGIRSATVNLGISQALHRSGVFRHIDYMSSVSGGGYLASSISSLMREKTTTITEIAGTVSVERGDATVVTVSPRLKSTVEPRVYRYARDATPAVANGSRVKAQQRLLRSGAAPGRGQNSLGAQFYWRVRPWALLREVRGKLDETRRWVNVSDGGHIENLASIELLRRCCRYIIIGDAEADPDHHFTGLATLIRSARIDLGVHIDIDVDALRLDAKTRRTKSHWAVGRIHYPLEETSGTLLYLKSSITGDEDEVIKQYRHASPSFPHESTADQSFTEGQFEAYRSLGQHMAEQALAESPASRVGQGEMSYVELRDWFQRLEERRIRSA